MELTRITIFGDGRTNPVIESGTEVIRIQDGQVAVMRYVKKVCEYSIFYLEPANNSNELNPLAKQMIKKENARLLKSPVLVIVKCPEEIRNKIIWNSQ